MYVYVGVYIQHTPPHTHGYYLPTCTSGVMCTHSTKGHYTTHYGGQYTHQWCPCPCASGSPHIHVHSTPHTHAHDEHTHTPHHSLTYHTTVPPCTILYAPCTQGYTCTHGTRTPQYTHTYYTYAFMMNMMDAYHSSLFLCIAYRSHAYARSLSSLRVSTITLLR